MLAPWKNSYDKPRQCIKKQRHHFANKGPYSQSYSFSSSHAWLWELDHKEGWAPKNWSFWTVVLEKTLESPLDCKIKPVNPKGDQPWVFIGRTDAEAEALWQMKKVKVKVTQSCLILCNPLDYAVHGILQARILEWVAFPVSRGSSQLRDQTQVSRIAGGFFTSWPTREAQEYWSG